MGGDRKHTTIGRGKGTSSDECFLIGTRYFSKGKLGHLSDLRKSLGFYLGIFHIKIILMLFYLFNLFELKIFHSHVSGSHLNLYLLQDKRTILKEYLSPWQRWLAFHRHSQIHRMLRWTWRVVDQEGTLT